MSILQIRPEEARTVARFLREQVVYESTINRHQVARAIAPFTGVIPPVEVKSLEGVKMLEGLIDKLVTAVWQGNQIAWDSTLYLHPPKLALSGVLCRYHAPHEAVKLMEYVHSQSGRGGWAWPQIDAANTCLRQLILLAKEGILETEERYKRAREIWRDEKPTG